MKNSGRTLCSFVNTKFINLPIIIVVFIFSCGINFINSCIRKKYDDVVLSKQSLIECNDAANLFKKQSDDLTFYVNDYINDVSKTSIDKFYQIIDENLREKEIEKVENYNIDSMPLKDALDLSDKLVERETHAFKLVSEAAGVTDVPRQVKDYVLTEEEEKLTAEEKINEARTLLRGKRYSDIKKSIYDKIDVFEHNAMYLTQKKLENECKNISDYLKYQHIFAALENIIVVFIGLVIYKKITVVLEEYTNSISENKAVEPKGTVELKYLGKAVNDYIQMQNMKQNELRYKAEIDPLTQVANRRTLEDFMDKKLRQKGSRGAFVFFDVDEFKNINDAYGHDVGDEVIKKLVAEVKNNFRDIDFVGRFGGDEFVVWIDDTSKENTDFIKERIDDINKNNISIADIVIKLTVSAGVTFCKEGDNYKDVLRRADEALYHIKRGGKKGCSIYEELEYV